ncbi:unnamed protein product [Closterium sp. Naga37s-1]|nr:unnamed protein product [Closterium sp. Naga37s-1]
MPAQTAHNEPPFIHSLSATPLHPSPPPSLQAPLLVRLLALPSPAFTSRWLHGPLTRALAAREVDAFVLFRPFPSLGLALHLTHSRLHSLNRSTSPLHRLSAAAPAVLSHGEEKKKAGEGAENGRSGLIGVEDSTETLSSGPFSFSEGGLVAATRAAYKEAAGSKSHSGSRGERGRGVGVGDGTSAGKLRGNFQFCRVDEQMVGRKRKEKGENKSEKRKRGSEGGKEESDWAEGVIWLEGGEGGAAAEADGVSGWASNGGAAKAQGGGRSGVGRGAGEEGGGAGGGAGGEGGVGSGWQSVVLLVKLFANLHCFDPNLCPGEQRHQSLNLVVSAIRHQEPFPPAPGEGAAGEGAAGEGAAGEGAPHGGGSDKVAEREGQRGREEAEAAVGMCENLCESRHAMAWHGAVGAEHEVREGMEGGETALGELTHGRGAGGSDEVCEEECFLSTISLAHSLIDFAATMPATHVSDDDVILISQFASALHAAICPHPSPHQHDDAGVKAVAERHGAWLAALQGRWDGQERWQRLQPAHEEEDGGDGGVEEA